MKSRNEAQAVDQEIVNYKIHRGLGIARMGKRQAAEFRIYGYNKDGVAVKEITADDAEIVWNPHLVNRKPEHHQFVGRWWESQYPEFVAENPSGRRCEMRKCWIPRNERSCW